MKKKFVIILTTVLVLGLAACQSKTSPDASPATPTQAEAPTDKPVATPTTVPTVVAEAPEPTAEPTVAVEPTLMPEPTEAPTVAPTATTVPASEPGPTVEPTAEPTVAVEPTAEPTVVSTATSAPTSTPSPTVEPVVEPTATPQPTATPKPSPTSKPTPVPTSTPTPIPTVTAVPTIDLSSIQIETVSEECGDNYSNLLGKYDEVASALVQKPDTVFYIKLPGTEYEGTLRMAGYVKQGNEILLRLNGDIVALNGTGTGNRTFLGSYRIVSATEEELEAFIGGKMKDFAKFLKEAPGGTPTPTPKPETTEVKIEVISREYGDDVFALMGFSDRRKELPSVQAGVNVFLVDDEKYNDLYNVRNVTYLLDGDILVMMATGNSWESEAKPWVNKGYIGTFRLVSAGAEQIEAFVLEEAYAFAKTLKVEPTPTPALPAGVKIEKISEETKEASAGLLEKFSNRMIGVPSADIHTVNPKDWGFDSYIEMLIYVVDENEVVLFTTGYEWNGTGDADNGYGLDQIEYLVTYRIAGASNAEIEECLKKDIAAFRKTLKEVPKPTAIPTPTPQPMPTGPLDPKVFHIDEHVCIKEGFHADVVGLGVEKDYYAGDGKQKLWIDEAGGLYVEYIIYTKPGDYMYEWDKQVVGEDKNAYSGMGTGSFSSIEEDKNEYEPGPDSLAIVERMKTTGEYLLSICINAQEWDGYMYLDTREWCCYYTYGGTEEELKAFLKETALEYDKTLWKEPDMEDFATYDKSEFKLFQRVGRTVYRKNVKFHQAKYYFPYATDEKFQKVNGDGGFSAANNGMIVVNGEAYKFKCRMNIKDSYETTLKNWEEGDQEVVNFKTTTYRGIECDEYDRHLGNYDNTIYHEIVAKFDNEFYLVVSFDVEEDNPDIPKDVIEAVLDLEYK